jgi:hypothetical protein
LIYEINEQESSMKKPIHKRRIVLRSLSTIAVASAAGIPLSAFTQAQKTQAQKLDEKDPQAISLGYKDDTTQVDKAKYPKHDPSQTCSNCQFYQQEKASGQLAPCTIFGGKLVAAKGWCSAYVKRPA